MVLARQYPLTGFLEWLMMSAVPGMARDVSPDFAAGNPADQDQALMHRLREGDREAFTELFEKWKRPLISFFYRSTGDYQISEDLTLEVAAKVYRARDRYRSGGRFSTWLFQIATNHLRDAWRRQNTRISSTPAADFDPGWTYPDSPNPLDQQERRVWEEWLQEALARFSEPERTALLLVAQQGMTPSEAAEVMERTPNHVRVLLNKARNRLRKILEEET